jgi:hypothetical protein
LSVKPVHQVARQLMEVEEVPTRPALVAVVADVLLLHILVRILLPLVQAAVAVYLGISAMVMVAQEVGQQVSMVTLVQVTRTDGEKVERKLPVAPVELHRNKMVLNILAALQVPMVIIVEEEVVGMVAEVLHMVVPVVVHRGLPASQSYSQILKVQIQAMEVSLFRGLKVPQDHKVR